MKFKRGIGLALIFTILLSFSINLPTSASVKVTDIDNFWGKDKIEYLVDKGIIEGYPTSVEGEVEYKPLDLINRAEFVTLLIKVFDKYDENAVCPQFTDVPGDAWYRPYVASAFNEGLTEGKGENIFAPDDSLSREELFTFIARAMVNYKGYGYPDDYSYYLDKFTDKDEVNTGFAVLPVSLCVQYGVVQGVENENGRMLYPKNLATRGEVASVIYGLVNLADYVEETPSPSIKPSPLITSSPSIKPSPSKTPTPTLIPDPDPGYIRVATTCVKLRLSSKSNNLREVLNLIDKTANACHPDVIVLSESILTRMNPGKVSEPDSDLGQSERVTGPCFAAIEAKAVQYGCYIVFNMNAPYEGEVPPKYYNSDFLISPAGEIVGRYDKNKVPLGELNDGLVPGTERPVFDINIRGMAWKVGMEICFDLDYGIDPDNNSWGVAPAYQPGEERVSTTLAKEGAQLIFASSVGDFVHEAGMDAQNNGVYMVIAGQDKYRVELPDYMNVGISAIIDPTGNALAQVTDRTGFARRVPPKPGDQVVKSPTGITYGLITYEELCYVYGQDGSYTFADLKTP